MRHISPSTDGGDDELGEHFIKNLQVAEDLASDGWNVFIEGDELVARKEDMVLTAEVAQHDRHAEEFLAEFLEDKDPEFVTQVTRGCLNYTAEERATFYETYDLEASEQ